METFVTVVHVIVALFIILVVLVQSGNSGGVGAAFGGGNSSSFFGASGGNTFFTRLTYGAALTFMVTSLTLTFVQGKSAKTGLGDRLKQQSTPAETPDSPAGETKPTVPPQP